MEQIGYSLIDSSNANTEIQTWGNIPGQVPAIPSVIVLPNGDSVCAPTLSDYGVYKLIKRMVSDNKPSQWHRKTSESISYDTANNQVVVTYVYPGPANILPDSVTPLQIRKALRQQSLLANVVSYIQNLSDDDRDEWEYMLTITPDNHIIQNAAISLGKTQNQINNLFRLAATL